LDQITKQAIGWSTRQQEMNAPESAQNAGSGAIIAILKSIDAAKKPLSIISIVKATNLGIDPAAAAIRDAVTTGLVSSHTQPDGVEFDLTAAGRSLI
jgi:predicted transcriptional regulator